MKQKLFTEVRQEPVLGIFLFLLYINDLPGVCESSQMVIFSNETTVINAEKRPDGAIKNDIVGICIQMVLI